MTGFWMVVLATGELYGGELRGMGMVKRSEADVKIGFMTFCPEWLTGSVNLDTSNFMYLLVAFPS